MKHLFPPSKVLVKVVGVTRPAPIDIGLPVIFSPSSLLACIASVHPSGDPAQSYLLQEAFSHQQFQAGVPTVEPSSLLL